jgi:hypothetical protein
MGFIDDGVNRRIPIKMRKDYFTLMMNEIDCFISPSEYLKNRYLKAGFPRSKFNVIWNGIDVKRFGEIVRTNSKKIRFTFVGYLADHKGFLVLLKALSLIDKKYFVILNVVGGGERMDFYKQESEKFGANVTVKFWGKINNDRMEDVYTETDVLILPSIWPENQPVSITEAMALGVPTIASNIGGIPELVENNVTGVLFKVGDGEDLAKKMTKFIGDPVLARGMGIKAKKKIASYTFENQVGKIIRLYSQVITAKSNLNKNIVACLGERVNDGCSKVMLEVNGSKLNDKPCFVMGNWLMDDQLVGVRFAWVVDNNITLREVIRFLKLGIPLLVPESNEALKSLCVRCNCGLYYSTVAELLVCLKFMIENSKEISIMAENARQA